MMQEDVILLLSNLRAELARQECLIEALNEQKKAIVSRDFDRVDQSVDELTRLGIEGVQLEKGRENITENLAASWSVPAKALKMPEIAKKLGSSFPELSAIHEQLKGKVKQVADLSRNVGLLVKQYREVYSIATSMLFEAAGIEPGQADPKSPSGVIINAEG